MNERGGCTKTNCVYENKTKFDCRGDRTRTCKARLPTYPGSQSYDDIFQTSPEIAMHH